MGAPRLRVEIQKRDPRLHRESQKRGPRLRGGVQKRGQRLRGESQKRAPRAQMMKLKSVARLRLETQKAGALRFRGETQKRALRLRAEIQTRAHVKNRKAGVPRPRFRFQKRMAPPHLVKTKKRGSADQKLGTIPRQGQRKSWGHMSHLGHNKNGTNVWKI